jgi:hypothetical protein
MKSFWFAVARAVSCCGLSLEGLKNPCSGRWKTLDTFKLVCCCLYGCLRAWSVTVLAWFIAGGSQQQHRWLVIVARFVVIGPGYVAFSFLGTRIDWCGKRPRRKIGRLHIHRSFTYRR